MICGINTWKKSVSAMLLCVLMVVGCQNKDISKDEEKSITVAISSETGTLDPAGMVALTYLAYSSQALDELLTYDEDGEIIYRAAHSYEVNKELTDWTFHLRKEALWSDGTSVTAGDFLNTMIRALDPKGGNGYANYLFPIKNAEAIYQGEADISTLGVEAIDDYTLRIELESPCVYFLDLLRLPVYTPSCKKYAKEIESGWDKNPKKSVANGPFYLEEYVPEQYFVLRKNPKYWNKKEIYLDKITYRFFDDAQSMANAYEAGEVDVATGLPSSVMILYEKKEDLVIADTITTRYIYPNLSVKPLDDVRVRKAMNLAINRKDLCKIVGEDTVPTMNLVAKAMKDKHTGEYFVDGDVAPFEENVEEAKKLLAEAGYPNGKGFPVLVYKYPSLEMDSDTAQVLKEQLKKNLNITIELKAQDLQSNYATRHLGEFDLCRMNWTADFADPYTYLSMLLSNSTYNCSGIKDEIYDDIVARSDVTLDQVKRNDLLHQAEQRAVGEKFYIIPLFGMKSCNLICPKITGIGQIPATGALEYRSADIKE